MQVDYKPTVDRVIQKYEGPYGWNKGDPGGPTKYGITCYDLAERRGQKMDSMARWAPLVEAMPLSEAEAIYQNKYALGIGFNALPAGIDACMFDYAVNSGVARPIRVACALLKLPESSRMTAEIFAAVKNCDPHWFITAMCAERLHFMHGIRNGTAWDRFGKGWGARVEDIQNFSDHLVTAPPETAPAAPQVSPAPKAVHPDTHAGRSAATTAGSTTTAAVTVHALGAPFWITAAIFGVGIVGAVWAYLEIKNKAAVANTTVVLPPNVKPVGA